jgi:serine/threonine-protein kinase
MGEVARAYDTRLRRAVAIKRLLPTDGDAARRRAARLLREARLIANLTHPNIVAVHDVGDAEGSPFIVMELVEGSSLAQRMHARVTTAQALAWLTQIADALDCAHRTGLVHRDIKPANLLVSLNGHIKVADFGAAKEVGPTATLAQTSARTRDGFVVGSEGYMAPEQLRAEPLDGRADLFAWAVVAYEILAGVHPYRAGRVPVTEQVVADGAFVPPPLRILAPEVPVEVERIVMHCLAAEPSARPPDMAYVKAALEAAIPRRPDDGLVVSSLTGVTKAEPISTPELGTLLAGRYRVLRELGRGGMGVVYLVEHTNTGDQLAMKVLLSDAGSNTQLVERFKREARASAKIRSEHVVRVTDADVAPELGGAPFFVMEALSGTDLEERIKRQGPLPPAEVASILRQIASALDKAHALGVVHRDLKPQNLFLHQRDDGTTIVKILDFGISKMGDANGASFMRSEMTALGAVMGTPLYMAPEQARGDNDMVGPGSDIWALGLIAVRLLTGQAYWRATSLQELLPQILTRPLVAPSSIFPSLDPAFDRWFMRSCDRDTTRRWRSAGEQANALADVLATLPTLAKAPTPAPLELQATWIAPAQARPVTPPARARSRAAPAVGTALALVLLAAVPVIWTVARHPRSTAAPSVASPPDAPASLAVGSAAEPAASPRGETGVALAAPSDSPPVGPGRPRAPALKTAPHVATSAPARRVAPVRSSDAYEQM